VKAGVVIGVVLSAVAILFAIFGQPNLGADGTRTLWIEVGVTPVIAAAFGGARILSDFFPRMVFGCCAVLAPGALAAAVVCLFTGRSGFAVPFAVWVVTSVVAVWVSSRISTAIAMRIRAGNAALAAEAARVKCPGCGQEVQALPGKCPWCARDLRRQDG
jgi:hypothetical protein